MGESDIQTETNIDKPTETPIENADPQQNEEEKKNNSEGNSDILDIINKTYK